jgi:hypothetical protein
MKEQIAIIQDVEAIKEIEKASIDMQISTAKAYPRTIGRAIDNAIATVTRSEKTASTCGYKLTFRGGKPIVGKSVYLAKILAQSWGNLRTGQRIIGENASHVIAQGICFDLETNISHTVEVNKPILKKSGERYTADMIATVGMAAASIAVRNAILSVIPQAVSDEVYEAAERKLLGELTKEDRLLAKRAEMLELFNERYKISEEQILKHFEIKSVEQLDPNKVKCLIDMDVAFSEGTLTVDDMFSLPTNAENNASYSEDLKDANKPEKKDEKKKVEKPNIVGELPLK